MPVEDLTPTRFLGQLSDSTFLSRISIIEPYADGFFLNDFQNGRVLHLDDQLKVVNSFGAVGEGPGEFVGVGPLAVYEDSLYVYDDRGRRFHVFDTRGVYHRTFASPASLQSRFAIHEGRFYFSTHSSERPVTSANYSGEVVNRFGSWLGDEEGVARYWRNHRILRTDTHGNVFAASISEPIVEKYTADGELLETLDLSGVAVLKSLFRLAKEKREKARQKGNQNVITVAFQDLFLKEGRFYLLTSHWKGHNTFSHLLEIDTSGPQMRLARILRLYGETPDMLWLNTVGISEAGWLLAFSTYTSMLYQYDLVEDHSLVQHEVFKR